MGNLILIDEDSDEWLCDMGCVCCRKLVRYCWEVAQYVAESCRRQNPCSSHKHLFWRYQSKLKGSKEKTSWGFALLWMNLINFKLLRHKIKHDMAFTTETAIHQFSYSFLYHLHIFYKHSISRNEKLRDTTTEVQMVVSDRSSTWSYWMKEYSFESNSDP